MGVDDCYLRCLNVCFDGAWDAASYRWYLKRTFGSLSPSILTIVTQDEMVAGIGVNYRQLGLPSGEVVKTGIITAAWTLPKHGGRWYLSKLVKAAKEVARAEGCGVLLSFVTEGNASCAVTLLSSVWQVQAGDRM